MISVIICHHRGDLLRLALTTVLKSREVEFEIIVATSDFEKIESWRKEFKDVRFVDIEGGPAKKRNIASRYASGELLAFYDDDTEITPYSLFYMAEALKDEKVGMVYGKLLNMEFRNRFDEAGSYLTSTGFLWARAESGIEDKGQFQEACCILAGKSAACMVRRKVFSEIGGFDVSYEILGEETDLSWRIWLRGYKVLFEPKSITFHAFNTRLKPKDFYIPRRVYFNGCRNYLSMLFTNLEGKNLFLPILINVVVWIIAGIGMFLTGKFEASFNIFNGLLYVFRNFRLLLKKREFVQSHRKISDKELLPIIMRNPPILYYLNRFFSYIKHGRHGGSYDPPRLTDTGIRSSL